MFKKISYLVSVSVLTSVLMGSASYAIYEKELVDTINGFCIKQKAPRADEAPSDEDQSWWETTVSYAAWAARPVGKVTGSVLRTTGDLVRGKENFVGDLLVNRATQAVGQLKIGGIDALAIVEQAQANKGVIENARLTVGNSLRWIGACCQDETRTLERELRAFFIDKRSIDNPEDVFTSVACALYLADEIDGVDAIKDAYRRFVQTWNTSSYTHHSLDEALNLQYFLNGIIRGYVHSDTLFPEEGFPVEVYSIEFDKLSVTKRLTQDVVVPNQKEREDMKLGELAIVVKEKRQSFFNEYIQSVYAFESQKRAIDWSRKKKSAVAPLDDQLAIEYAPINDGRNSIVISEVNNQGGLSQSKVKELDEMDQVD
ncbi:MAG: hypothetical protein K2W92_10480 [Alphaproteobacteria bacterium]|nr:hypothetical protein [Alphaproteobacteria bacterium]